MQVPDDLMDALAEADIAVCHTLGTTQAPPPFIKEAWDKTGMSYPAKVSMAGLMYDHGVRTVAGALASATSQAAKLCGVTKGVLKPGWDADIIAVQGDPMRDITALHNVTTVVVAGQIVMTTLPADRRE